MLELISKIGAIIGSILYQIVFIKAWKKDKKEAKQSRIKESQHLVKVVSKRSHTITNRPASDLCIVNNDTRPVTRVHVDFFIDNNAVKPVYSKDFLSLGPSEEIFIHQFGLGESIYKVADFTYTDASGHVHEYRQSIV